MSETKPVKTKLFSEPALISRLTSNGYLSDVVRIWQFRAPIGDVRQNALPVCATKPGEGTHIQAFGFGVDFDSQAKSEIALSTALNAPLSIGAASDPLAIRPLVLATPTATPTTNSNASNAGTSFSAKQMGMAVGLFLNEPSRSLAERLGLLFSNKNQLNISPYIMRMGGTSSQPGESGSPIFSVSMSGSNPFSSGFINPKDIAKWECLAGLVSREVASRKAGSDELEWDTFYTPLLSYSERSWSSVEIQRGVSLARTYSTLVGANIASVPLALTNRGEPSNATMDSSPLAGQTVVQKSLSGRHLNVNAETVFGANVFKSASPKEIIIESGA
ncbi:hypothetical protein EBR21_18280, partial [bacterium]|nr:hypothetical protein [bacterium]